MATRNTRRKPIELTDVLALRFECKKCGTILAVSLKEFSERHELYMLQKRKEPQKAKLPFADCPVCAHTWASQQVVLAEFVEHFNKLIGLLQPEESQNPPGFSL